MSPSKHLVFATCHRCLLQSSGLHLPLFPIDPYAFDLKVRKRQQQNILLAKELDLKQLVLPSGKELLPQIGLSVGILEWSNADKQFVKAHPSTHEKR